MRNFYGYLQDRAISDQQHRIANLMAERAVNPYVYIENYLDNQVLLTEGWIGNFFKRIGNAWNGFWKNPNPTDNAMTRLEAAKKALEDLTQMMQQNQGADQWAIQVVMKGLEQSLSIVNKIEPSVQKLSSGIEQFAKNGTPHSDPHDGLPPDLDRKWVEIIHKRDALIREPDTEAKIQKLLANDDEWIAFRQQLEELNQTINPHDADEGKREQKKRIENWLQRIDNDATFRQIEYLLDAARKRSGTNNMLVQRPGDVGFVLKAWREIQSKVTEPNQQKQMLLAWYAKLPPNNPVRAFIQQEMKNSPQLGTNENEVFLKYANEWITKFPHHMAN